MAADSTSGGFERAFWGAAQYALDTGFTEILELKPVQEEALLHFVKREDVFVVLPTGCGKLLIFQHVPKVYECLHDQGFKYPKAAILVVFCPLSALLDSHQIQELKDHGILTTLVCMPSAIFRTIRASDSSSIFFLNIRLDGYRRFTCEKKTLITIIQSSHGGYVIFFHGERPALKPNTMEIRKRCEKLRSCCWVEGKRPTTINISCPSQQKCSSWLYYR